MNERTYTWEDTTDFWVDMSHLSEKDFDQLCEDFDQNDIGYDISGYDFWKACCDDREYWYCGSLLDRDKTYTALEIEQLESKLASILDKYKLLYYGGSEYFCDHMNYSCTVMHNHE